MYGPVRCLVYISLLTFSGLGSRSPSLPLTGSVSSLVPPHSPTSPRSPKGPSRRLSSMSAICKGLNLPLGGGSSKERVVEKEPVTSPTLQLLGLPIFPMLPSTSVTIYTDLLVKDGIQATNVIICSIPRLASYVF